MEGGLDEHSRSALHGISEYLVHGFAQQAHRSAWTQVGVCADLPRHEVFAECLRCRFL